MNYLKLKNVPLKLWEQEKYGEGSKLAWENCGFNESVTMALSYQYVDADGQWIQVLPISNRVKFDAIVDMFTADVAIINDADTEKEHSFEVLDHTEFLSRKQDSKNWRIAQKALSTPV